MGGVLDASNTLIATITGNATVGGQISAVNDIHLFAKDMNVTGSVYTEKENSIYLVQRSNIIRKT